MNVLLGAFAFVVERASPQLWVGLGVLLINLLWLVWFIRALLK